MQPAPPAVTFRHGSPTNVQTRSRPGLALVGGGGNVDEAFKWMAERSDRGDFVVLRASGGDETGSYLATLAPQLNSVETIVITDRQQAFDPAVVDKVRNAEALFIAGGDQWNYVSMWRDSPLSAAIDDLATRAPLGGTSAGLAVLGEYVYDAQRGSVTSEEALAHADEPQVTLTHNFFHLGDMRGIVTDTHFQQRDRMGRLCDFVARSAGSGEGRGIGVNERTAVLVEPGGKARVVGESAAFFVRQPAGHPANTDHGPLRAGPFDVQRVDANQVFDLSTWSGVPSRHYHIRADAGRLHSDQPDDAIY
jgi:cyanophycinase